MPPLMTPQDTKTFAKRMTARWRRYWLVTHTRRKVVKWGCVALGVGLSFGVLTSSTVWREVETIRQDVMAQLKARPELLVHELRISGGSAQLQTEVAQELNLRLPISRLDLDLHLVEAQAQSFASVHRASVLVTPEGVLDVMLTEREPAFVWLNHEGYFVVDQEGAVVGAIEARADMPHLPLIVDEGAEQAVFEAQAIFDQVATVASEVKGLRRVGERRWTILLSHGRQVLLPQEDPEMAVEEFLALAAQEDLLSREFSQLDLRLPHRHTLRVGGSADLTLTSRAATE